PLGIGANAPVRALTLYNDNLVAAGDFTGIGSVLAGHVAQWDGAAWHPLAGGGANGTINALSAYAGELIAGGSFTTAGGQPASNIARWNGMAWQRLGSSVFTNGTNGAVSALTPLGPDLIVGGAFGSAGGVGAPHIARWNGSDWQSLGPGLA